MSNPNPQSAAAKVYRYVDAEGRPALVDALERVPSEHRATAEALSVGEASRAAEVLGLDPLSVGVGFGGAIALWVGLKILKGAAKLVFWLVVLALVASAFAGWLPWAEAAALGLEEITS